MGTTETALLLKYGIPLAVKLLADGKDETETTESVVKAVAGMSAGGIDIGDKLLNADKEQSDGIIEGLFGVITGAGNALGSLVKAFFGLFGG